MIGWVIAAVITALVAWPLISLNVARSSKWFALAPVALVLVTLVIYLSLGEPVLLGR